MAPGRRELAERRFGADLHLLFRRRSGWAGNGEATIQFKPPRAGGSGRENRRFGFPPSADTDVLDEIPDPEASLAALFCLRFVCRFVLTSLGRLSACHAMNLIARWMSVGALGMSMALSSPMAEAQTIAKDFVITDRATKAPIRLSDFAGKIVFLDFFAYWCTPCRASSPVVEKDIAEYYEQKGGNPNGIKVEVIGVNIESDNPQLTDAFVSQIGFKKVADDFGAADGAWAQFGKGGIPHFVIINGVDAQSHAQWEVLHSDVGFRGAAFYRGLIDSVKPKTTDPGTDPGTDPESGPEIVIEQPVGSSLVAGQSTRNFGKIRVKAQSGWLNFIIKNRGDANLSNLKVRRSGRNPKDFILTPISRGSINPGGATSVRVRFAPKAVGLRTAVLEISSNDADESPFTITITGTGLAQKRVK